VSTHVSEAARDAAAAIQRVAVVGTGVIGASWAALFLARGLKVFACDPAPNAEAALHRQLAAHWSVLRPDAPDDAWRQDLRFSAHLPDAVADADFVQENGPERLDVKRALYAELDAASPEAAVLATSSSTLLVSDVQAGCPRFPQRVVLGHPFNPPHLIPLVEVVGGKATSDLAIETAVAFYARIGRKPVRLKREIFGHIANRLQAALWQEAFHLLQEGIASVADLDAAIAHGPGLRWALLGPFLPAFVRRRGRHAPHARPPRRTHRGDVARAGQGHPDRGTESHHHRRRGAGTQLHRPGRTGRRARRGPA
jgi:3-hydroxyacyl-CoA dehydrogenase